MTGTAQQIDYDYTFHANGAVASEVLRRTLSTGVVASTTTFYDTLGNRTSFTNFIGQTETWANFNGRGQPGTYTNINGISSDFIYEQSGNLKTITERMPTGNRVTTFSYNHGRQITDITFPDGRASRWRYTASGRVEYTGDALHTFVKTWKDVLNNSITETSDRHVPIPNGGTPVAYPGSGGFSSTTDFDSLGRPYAVKGNQNQRRDYRYDNNGNLKSETIDYRTLRTTTMSKIGSLRPQPPMVALPKWVTISMAIWNG